MIAPTTTNRSLVTMPSARQPTPVYLWLPIPIAFLAFAASVVGIFGTAHDKETENWAAQAVATDLVNVAVAVPPLLILGFLARRGSLRARLAWAGVVAYMVYAYAIQTR